MQHLQQRNHFLENKLVEADELVQQMSRLIDVSRNKQLQKLLIRYAEQESYPEQVSEEEYNSNQSNQMSQQRHPNNIRVRDGRKKKKDPNTSIQTMKRANQLQPINRSGSKKRDNSASRTQNSAGFSNFDAAPIAEKPRKKKKKTGQLNETVFATETFNGV